jgi:hypothetical protein
MPMETVSAVFNVSSKTRSPVVLVKSARPMLSFFGFESYLLWNMAWLMSGQNSRNTTVIPSRETFSIHR